MAQAKIINKSDVKRVHEDTVEIELKEEGSKLIIGSSFGDVYFHCIKDDKTIFRISYKEHTAEDIFIACLKHLTIWEDQDNYYQTIKDEVSRRMDIIEEVLPMTPDMPTELDYKTKYEYNGALGELNELYVFIESLKGELK